MGAYAVVVAGSTLDDAVWFGDALDLQERVAVLHASMANSSLDGLRVSAVVVTPSFALAASGALGDVKGRRAQGLLSSLRRSLAATDLGSRVRATSLHALIKQDEALGDGFYSLPFPAAEAVESEFRVVAAESVDRFVEGNMDDPRERTTTYQLKSVEQQPFAKGGLIENVTLMSGPPSATDLDQVMLALRRQERSLR